MHLSNSSNLARFKTKIEKKRSSLRSRFCFVNLAANLVNIEEAVSPRVSCSLDLIATIDWIMKVELQLNALDGIL